MVSSGHLAKAGKLRIEAETGPGDVGGYLILPLMSEEALRTRLLERCIRAGKDEV